MKALVVSDSHGLKKELVELANHWSDKVDVMIHCGDSELGLNDPILHPYKVVRGNCDYYELFPNDLVLTVEGFTIFATHGHMYNCKMTLQNLYYKAKEEGASIVVFGHSHIRGVEKIEEVVFLNPGSILMPRTYKEKTYAMIDGNEKELQVTFYSLEHKVVDQVTIELS